MEKRLLRCLSLGAEWLIVLCMAFSGSPTLASPNPFPQYECLRPNVDFWRKVYTQYTTRHGIIHDNEDLSIVYEVVKLEDPELRGAQATNKKRIERIKVKYQDVLEKLAKGETPSTDEEKRVAGFFGPDAKRSDFRRAQENIRCQIGQMDRFREGVIRSGAFLDEIKKIFASYGLPTDLAYLPHVESSFNYNAYSKFGAAGIWQFTQSTGKKFMQIGYTIDERRDPIRSTHAAAKLLKLNYEALGNWPMAITAYNHGLAGVMRAKQSKGTFEAIVREYDGRSFKFASRNFYCEFLAALDTAKSYRKYFGDLNLQKPRKTREIVLTAYAPVKELTRHMKVSLAEIKELNPSLRQPVFDGRKYIPKGFALRLPHGATPGQETLLAEAELPKEVLKPGQKKSLFYSVRRGDTVSEIARAHGLSPLQLIVANDLDSKGRIYIGQNLRLPASDEKPERLAMAKAASQTDVRPNIPKTPPAALPEPKSKPPEADSSPSPPPPAEEKPKEAKPSVNLAVVTGELVVEEVTVQKGKSIGVIRVEVEETLGHYADWAGVTSHEIRRLNHLTRNRSLRLKEAIKIPLRKVTKEEFEENRFEYHKELQEDFFASYEVAGVETYSVKTGDNIWKLCHEVFDVPFWLILKYNPDVDFSKLNPSDNLVVPVVLTKETSPDGGSSAG